MSVIDDHIDPTDAQQVDIIHTDEVMGILQPLGTVDFFVTGGKNQPNCPEGEGINLMSCYSVGRFKNKLNLYRMLLQSHARLLFVSRVD